MHQHIYFILRCILNQAKDPSKYKLTPRIPSFNPLIFGEFDINIVTGSNDATDKSKIDGREVCALAMTAAPEKIQYQGCLIPEFCGIFFL